MNILHINQSDISGGAAIAGYRLHEGLLAQAVNSRLLVGQVKTSSDRVAKVPRAHRLEKYLANVTQHIGHYLEYVKSFKIPEHPFYQEADILNFHNLHTGYFNYLAIPTLTKSKPAILTLHDMWSFTGHCAYSYECDRWKTGCGQCPHPETYPEIQRDNTPIEWHLKKWAYSHANLTIVAPSQWLAQQAQASILNRFPIHHIPYGIDTDIYQPIDPALCRNLLNLPQDKHCLMFAADNIGDYRKGADLLLTALKQLPPSLKQNITLITLGTGGENIGEQSGLETCNLGYVGSDRLKAIAYSAADLFIFPTRADNLPLVLQESMACGTPMVSFAIGGVPDLVRPGITGHLAPPEDATSFCNGIVQLLENAPLRQTMQQNCRQIALSEYPLALQATRYMELYQKVLSGAVDRSPSHSPAVSLTQSA